MERASALRILVFVFFILIGLVSPAEAKRVALVIGNSSYEHASKLENPKNDANALAAVLERLNFEVVKGIDLKQLEFEKTVRKFARTVRGADVALLFYAGHGLQVNGRNYLAPVDAKLSDEADLDFETLPLRTILKQMEREAKTNLVFLDACRDNPLARNLARSMGTRSAGVGRGLARVDSGVGTLIAFATEPGNVALDGEGNNSPFTSALLKHIETPGVDVDIMLRRVRKEVLDRTAGRQVPWSNSSLTGRFEFVGKLEVTVENKAPEDDKRITELQDELKKLKQQLASKPAPEQKPKDDKKLAALQKELAELREELKKRPATKPEPRDDGNAAEPQNEIAPLKQRLGKAEMVKKTAPDEKTKVAIGIHPDKLAKSLDNQTNASSHECDRQAANPFDPMKKAAGIPFKDIEAWRAIKACQEALGQYPNEPRFMFQLGRALAKSSRHKEAVQLYREAAQQNYSAAFYNLGQSYRKGQGVKKDIQKALKWYQRAAAVDYSPAMTNIGAMYSSGIGVAKNQKKAANWYQRSAEMGHPLAMTNLAELYIAGDGVPKDAKEAAKWYRNAAAKGFPKGHYFLGMMYAQGRGVPKDEEKAAQHLFEALKTGSPLARKRARISVSVWSEEIRQELQRLLREEGVYSGPVDGNFGRETQKAIDKLTRKKS